MGGVMILMGIWMLWTEKKADFHRHEGEGESAGCCNYAHDFFHHHSSHHAHSQPSSLRQIFVLGFCSGAIPCLSGLAILTMAWSTVNLGRGILMVSAFSAGLGLVVLILCVAMQQVAQVMDRYWQGAVRWSRYLPIVSSALIILMGLAVLWHGWKTL